MAIEWGNSMIKRYQTPPKVNPGTQATVQGFEQLFFQEGDPPPAVTLWDQQEWQEYGGKDVESILLSPLSHSFRHFPPRFVHVCPPYSTMTRTSGAQ